jgi:hypothetical protein
MPQLSRRPNIFARGLRWLNEFALFQEASQFFDPSSIHSKIVISGSRGGPHCHCSLRRPQFQFQIIDESKNETARFGTEVILAIHHHLGARQGGDGRSNLGPGFGTRVTQ